MSRVDHRPTQESAWSTPPAGAQFTSLLTSFPQVTTACSAQNGPMNYFTLAGRLHSSLHCRLRVRAFVVPPLPPWPAASRSPLASRGQHCATALPTRAGSESRWRRARPWAHVNNGGCRLVGHPPRPAPAQTRRDGPGAQSEQGRSPVNDTTTIAGPTAVASTEPSETAAGRRRVVHAVVWLLPV
jgi:hypothetical protein